MAITTAIQQGRRIGDTVYTFADTLTDETDYLVIPPGYNVSVTFGGAGSAVVSYATEPCETGADMAGTWTVTTENPLQSAQPGSISALKIVATGAVTVAGRMT